MKTSAAAVGAACWPVCLVEYEHFHTGTGLGHGTGFAAGGGGGGVVRSVSHPAGAGAPAAVGQCAGLCVLGVCDCGSVPLVAGGLGRTNSIIRGCGAVCGRGDLFPPGQRRFAELGLPGCRSGHNIVPFGTFAHARHAFPAEKNEKFCKKPLSIWPQMV